MKIRTMTGILIVALVALSVGVAAAQYGQGGDAQYVDANGDGIYDNIGTRLGFVDADGDSVCDNLGDFGRGRGGCGCGEQGTNFVDANGDGVCDGIPNGQDDDYKPLRDGSGRGNGGPGKGRNL